MTPHSVGVAAQCVCPSGAASSAGPSPPPGFSFGHSFATHDAAYCPKGGARSGAVSALSVAPGLSNPSKVASAIALYDSAIASNAPDLDTLHTSIRAFAGPLPRIESLNAANVAAGIHVLAVDVSGANSTREATISPSSSFSTITSPPRIVAGSKPSRGIATANSQWLSLAAWTSMRVLGTGAMATAVMVRIPPLSASCSDTRVGPSSGGNVGVTESSTDAPSSMGFLGLTSSSSSGAPSPPASGSASAASSPSAGASGSGLGRSPSNGIFVSAYDPPIDSTPVVNASMSTLTVPIAASPL